MSKFEYREDSICLEQMIDRISLSCVIDVLGDICEEKTCLNENSPDIALTQAWRQAAWLLHVLAGKIRNENL